MSPVTQAGVAPALARIHDIRSRFGETTPTSTTTGTEATAFASLLGAPSPTATGSALTAGATATGVAATGADALEAAGKYLGVPYVWGGTDPSRGLDCSGLVQRAYRDLGVELPRVSRDQARVGTEVPSLDQARPGDLIAFGQPVDHISIYAGDGKILHAPRTGDVVKVADIHRPIATIRRVLPEGAATTAAIGSTSTAVTAAAPGLGAADAVAMRQLLQLVTRSLTASAASSYGSTPSLGLGIGADDQALGSMLNGGSL